MESTTAKRWNKLNNPWELIISLFVDGITQREFTRYLTKSQIVSERKLRFLVCAMCRQIWSHLGEGAQNCVLYSEMWADGSGKGKVKAEEYSYGNGPYLAALITLRHDRIHDLLQFLQHYGMTNKEVSDLIRHVLGNPFKN